MNFTKFAGSILKNNSYRITKARLLIIDVLQSADKPLNAYEISELVKKKAAKVDVSTVYRVLSVFENLGLVHFNTGTQGYSACGDFSCHVEGHCHHQFVCQRCKGVKEVHIDDHSFLKTIQKQFEQLDIRHHSLELSGICNTCKS